jgi:steroid 5-alpha reductase family enzyme
MSVAEVLAASAAFIAAWMLAFWLASLPRRNAAIVDIGWGPGFAAVAVLAFVLGDGWQPRGLLVLALTAIWGLRLGGYLAWRNHGQPEDRRYQAMRRRHGERFAWVSLYSVFALQGAVMWVVSLPVQLVMAAPAPAAWTPFDFAGVVVWSVGMVFEAIGDWQLARFKADPTSSGQVMDRGLWRYTRHPNYFGDFCVWWGLWLVACAAPGGWWTAAGPAVMSFFLMKVSGVPMLERDLVRRRPGYADYVRRTSAFFPRPPR